MADNVLAETSIEDLSFVIENWNKIKSIIEMDKEDVVISLQKKKDKKIIEAFPLSKYDFEYGEECCGKVCDFEISELDWAYIALNNEFEKEHKEYDYLTESNIRLKIAGISICIYQNGCNEDPNVNVSINHKTIKSSNINDSDIEVAFKTIASYLRIPVDSWKYIRNVIISSLMGYCTVECDFNYWLMQDEIY